MPEKYYPHTRKQLLSTIPVLIVAVLGLGWVWLANPGLVFQLQTGVEDVFHQSMSVVTGEDLEVGEELVFTESDVDRLNTLWIERSHEVGFCGIVRSDGDTELWMADTIEASESHIRFTWSNCPFTSLTPESSRLMLHTHPGGTPELSPTDKEVFLDSNFAYSCIQYNKVSSVGDTVNGLNCFTKDGVESVDDTFPEIEVGVE